MWKSVLILYSNEGIFHLMNFVMIIPVFLDIPVFGHFYVRIRDLLGFGFIFRI